MKRTPKLFFLSAILFFNAVSHAQSCDPWITKVYKQLYGRNPSTAECNIKNYNNGSWSNYCELTGFIAGYNRNRSGISLKGDPWIFQAYCELYGRAPQLWELNIQNYNNGSWANYGELKAFIQEAQKDWASNNLRPLAGTTNTGKPATVFVDPNNTLLAIDLVSPEGGAVIAPGGANVIAAGGGNAVAAGGANFQFNSNTPGISFGSDRIIHSAGTRVIQTAGKTKLVLK